MENKNNYNFFAFLSRMKYINRWGLMKNTQNENIQEHSYQVAVIAHAIGVIKNSYFNGNVVPDRIAVLSLFHDSNEIITGDLPTPIKYLNSDIAMVYKDIEKLANNKLLSLLPDELKLTYQNLLFKTAEDEYNWMVVKAADRISAYLKCLEEKNSGNKEFKKAGETIFNSIKEIELPEVKYFVEKFVPAFELSLDEFE